LKHLFPIVTSVAAIFCTAGSIWAADPKTGAAAAYCEQTGGAVIERAPYYNTNGPFADWLRLSGVKDFCQYTSPTDGSRIHVLLETLYTTTASLAVSAYYAKLTPGTCEGNPASCYCSLLGGSDLFGGVTGAGGGWVGQNSPDTVLEACIFPDMSSIDSWGLTYYAEGIIRGIDLTTVLRYVPPPAKAK
jgi:hypothetical protein